MESLDRLKFMLDNYPKIFYCRFGDGEIRLMAGRSENYHKVSSGLKIELRQAMSIKHHSFMIAASVGCPFKTDIRARVFKINRGRVSTLQKFTKKVTSERHFYNPIIFHYLAAFNPQALKEFVNIYIKPKIKMFIGSNNKQSMESFYGPIDYYIYTSPKQAYYTINQWWPHVKKYVSKCQVVLPSAGAASNVIQKRIWNLKTKVHCIDIGSLNDAIQGDIKRAWIRRVGLKRIVKNLVK